MTAQPVAVPAEVARAVQILRKHNEWRRGADNNHWQSTPYSPAELGRAIDTVCDHVSHSAQPDVLKRATEYAHDIVTWLHRDHYADNTTFEPFGDLLGLLSQIDNMICGWKEPAAPVVPDEVATLPSSFDDESVERISEAARRSYRRHMGGVRGQQFSPRDDLEYHVMHAVLDECRAILAAGTEVKNGN